MSASRPAVRAHRGRALVAGAAADHGGRACWSRRCWRRWSCGRLRRSWAAWGVLAGPCWPRRRPRFPSPPLQLLPRHGRLGRPAGDVPAPAAGPTRPRLVWASPASWRRGISPGFGPVPGCCIRRRGPSGWSAPMCWPPDRPTTRTGTRLFFINLPFFAAEVAPALRNAADRPDLDVYPLTFAQEQFFPTTEVAVEQEDDHTLLVHPSKKGFFSGAFGDQVQLGLVRRPPRRPASGPGGGAACGRVDAVPGRSGRCGSAGGPGAAVRVRPPPGRSELSLLLGFAPGCGGASFRRRPRAATTPPRTKPTTLHPRNISWPATANGCGGCRSLAGALLDVLARWPF